MARQSAGRRGQPGRGRASGSRRDRGAERSRARSESAPGAAEGPSGPFRLGAVPGATPGKWIERWREQRPQTRIELIPLAVADQRTALDGDRVDAAIVRLPLDGDPDAVHLIRLYEEVPVVVASREASIMAADELEPGDFAGEVRITPQDDVLGELGLPTEPARFEVPATTEEAIALAATGVGVVIVPQSLARLHHRRDVDHRPLVGGPLSSVGLAWLRERDGDDVQHLVGITRGRTPRSSR